MSYQKYIQKTYLSSHKKFINNTINNLEVVLSQNINLNKNTLEKIKKMFKMQLVFDFNSFNNSKLIIDKSIRNLVENEVELKLSQITNCKTNDYNNIFDLINCNQDDDYDDDNDDDDDDSDHDNNESDGENNSDNDANYEIDNHDCNYDIISDNASDIISDNDSDSDTEINGNHDDDNSDDNDDNHNSDNEDDVDDDNESNIDSVERHHNLIHDTRDLISNGKLIIV